MKRALLYFALFLAPLSLWSQSDRNALIIPDSAEYIRQHCNCQRSAAKYRDADRKVYHVYLDKDRDEIFIIRRHRDVFIRQTIEK